MTSDDRGRSPVFIARDGTLLALSRTVRERRAAARLAYTFDPGLALAERLTEPKAWHAEHATITPATIVIEDLP
jgi:hypothetical protein